MKNNYSKSYLLLYSILEVIFFVILVIKKLFTQNNKICNQGKNNKFLIIEPYQMGDVVSLASTFDPILENFPDAEIFLLIKKSNEQIFINDPRIKGMYFLDLPWTSHGKKSIKMFNFFKIRFSSELFTNYFDFGFDTRGDLRSQVILNLLKCHKKIGYVNGLGSNLKLRGLLLDIRVKVNRNYIHRYSRNRFLLTGIGINEIQLFPFQMPILFKDNIKRQKETNKVVIHVGAGWIFRRWNTVEWLALINYILCQNYKIVVISGKSEAIQLLEIKNYIQNQNLSFIIPDSILQLIELIESCNYFIGLDSGPLHIADSLNKPCIGLFGPGISQIWEPISYNSHIIHHYQGFECHPCTQRSCPHQESNCMSMISSSEVINNFKVMVSQNNA